MSSKKASDMMMDIMTDNFEVLIGKGLRQQIEESHKVPYTYMSPSDIRDNLIRLIFKEEFDQLDKLLKKNIIRDNQHATLTAMILSSDNESTELAQDLIKVITKKHGNRIHGT